MAVLHKIQILLWELGISDYDFIAAPVPAFEVWLTKQPVIRGRSLLLPQSICNSNEIGPLFADVTSSALSPTRHVIHPVIFVFRVMIK